MELIEVGKAELREALTENGTRPERVREILGHVGRHKLRMARDDAFTVLVAGNHVGVAKRAESGTKRDEPNGQIGLSVAASRL